MEVDEASLRAQQKSADAALDAAKSSRLSARYACLRGLRSDLIDPAIAAHRGRIVKRTGDGSIIEFRSVVDAVQCAIEVQNGLIERNAGVPEDRRIEFRVGIHVGDVVEENDGDLMGDGVNIAARLEGVAKPGAICLSEQAYWQVKGRLDLKVTDLGATQLKNIAEPVHVYSLEVGAPPTPGPAPRSRPMEPVAKSRRVSRRWAVVAALAGAIFAACTYAWHTGFAPRLLGVSVAENKLATAPRLSIIVLPFENLTKRRSRAGIFRRRHYGRSHYRPLASLQQLRHFARDGLHLQGQAH